MLIVRNQPTPHPYSFPESSERNATLVYNILSFRNYGLYLYLLDSAWLLTLLAMCGGRCSSRVRNFIFLAGHNGGTLGAILGTLLLTPNSLKLSTIQ